MLKFYVGAANVLIYDGLRDISAANPEAFVAIATITATLKTQDGETVDEVNGVNVPLLFVPGSKGRYLGTFSKELAIEDGSEYVLEVTSTGPDDFRRIAVKAEYRGVE